MFFKINILNYKFILRNSDTMEITFLNNFLESDSNYHFSVCLIYACIIVFKNDK